MEAVIFDRDGVIIDSESINILSATNAFTELGIEIKEEEKVLIYGRHPLDYMSEFLEKYNFSPEKFRELQRKNYYNLIDSAPLFDETISLIRKLHNVKIPVALATTSSLKNTLIVLKRAKLEEIFDSVVTSTDCEKRKPHPDPYLKSANNLNLDPSNCVVIEDSQVGLESAKRAGMKCVILKGKYNQDQDFSKADLIVNSASEISIDALKDL